MAKPRTNYMKATVWTPIMRSDCEGTPDGVIPLAFCALNTKARREACLAELHKIDDQLTALEESQLP